MYTSFLEKFEQIVEHDPTHVAIELDGNVVFTYQQLRDQARRIGMSLREKGIGKEDIVALYFEKSPEYLLALLSVWYAGAAYLPLPPSTPKERLDFILNNASPKVVLCDKGQLLDAGKHGAIFSLQNLLLDAPQYLPIDVALEDLAYVIYTSGSTGTPKGVLVNHSGIVNILEQQIELFGLGPASRSLFVLSITFDASLSDIGTALLSGATLCLESLDRAVLATSLMDVIEQRSITFVDMPPSLLSVHHPQTKPTSLECIVIGGEATGVEVIRSWAQVCRVVNVYGPTETTICSSMMVCDPQTWSGQNIGFPISGLDYVIVDGELWIGGVGVARGYQKLDQLTGEKFVELEGERYFRTGDAVEKHKDGFYFLGRIDRQIKIRGQLVAPEEIESVLMQYPNVERAAVVPLLDVQDRPRGLKAFIQTQHSIRQDSLREFLQKKLSSWMIPSDIDVVKHLPENLHAKIEFRQLKEQAKQSMDQDSSDRLQMLVRLWEEILGKKDIGIDQDFYELGGDSLATIEFLVRAKHEGIDITVELVAQQRTIRKIDAALSMVQQKDDGRSVELLEKDARLDAQMRTWVRQARALPSSTSSLILVTGANGFLGVRVVRELLMRTQNDLVLLMRRTTSEAAKSDFQNMVSAQQVEFDEQWYNRIRFVTGDVSKKQLGLSRDDWEELTESVGSIYHCAAMVNMTATYEQMKSVNVGGMREMIRFALTGVRKKLNDCSTLSVFVATNQYTGTVYEQDVLDKTEVVYGGYAQTKWVAERLLRAVPEEMLERNIFRFGLITGDTTTGVCSPHDYLRMFIEGLCCLGKIPEGNVAELEVDVTPVDYAAAAYVHLGQTQSQRTFHIANTHGFTLQMILDDLQTRCGIQIVSTEEWNAWMTKKHLSVKESATLMALCRLLPDAHAFDLYRSMDLFQATNITFDQQQTQAGLNGTSIVLPKADASLLQMYLNYFFDQEQSSTRIRGGNKHKTTGILVGKFLPLHRGHETLIRFASEFCDELTVLVDHIPTEPFGETFVSEHKRMEWVQEMFPNVCVKTFPKQMPQDPSERPDFFQIWQQEIRALLTCDPDYVFASEMYGFTIADLLGATHIPFDRDDVPGAVSGTMLRERLLLNWDQLASSVKKDFLYSVCVIGPESSGKSTLAKELAERYQTVCVPEYARAFLQKTTEAQPDALEVANVAFEDLDTIARGQIALATAMKPFANRLIIHDTNVLETQLWSEWFFHGKVSALVEELSRNDVQDVYILVSPDLPWKQDMVRYHPEQKDRQQFFDRCKEVLEERGLPYVVISGKGRKRLKQAIHAIDRRLEQDFDFAYFVRRLQV